MNFEEEEKQEGTMPEIPVLVYDLVDTILENYEPTDKPTNDTELKTTTDLLEEVSAIATVSKDDLVTVLQETGFKLKYIEPGFFWMLKRR